MSDTFTASNGTLVRVSAGGLVLFGTGGNLMPESAAALREFFQHERDKELGRWRSTIHPTWTAVVEESQGVAKFRNEDGLRAFTVHMETRDCSAWVEELREVAKEFLAAHPEPKPWHDAKHGEVWAVTDETGEHAYCVDPGQFYDFARDYAIGFWDEGITEGRRIWPENTPDQVGAA